MLAPRNEEDEISGEGGFAVAKNGVSPQERARRFNALAVTELLN